jgi:hypothetical protein
MVVVENVCQPHWNSIPAAWAVLFSDRDCAAQARFARIFF